MRLHRSAALAGTPARDAGRRRRGRRGSALEDDRRCVSRKQGRKTKELPPTAIRHTVTNVDGARDSEKVDPDA